MASAVLTRLIKGRALQLGFDAVGVAPAATLPADPLRQWLARGYHGEMGYLERNVDKRLDPSLVLEGVRSIVSVALNYYHDQPLPYGRPDRAVFSRYAWGDDYHGILGDRLDQLLRFVQRQEPGSRGKVYVDTGPVLDKQWASRSGLGWLGKNANVIAKRRTGSWFFVGEILLDVELDYDRPHADHCGSCTRCISACPTGAIVQPYVVDSRRCVSYLTIELRGDIPNQFREAMGNLVYGCDICQDVCPWNRKVEESTIDRFRPRAALASPDLRGLARLTEADFRRQFRGSPVKRTKWRGLMRNVAVAMGNSGDRRGVPELSWLLQSEEPLIRRHAAWALGRLGGPRACRALRSRLQEESDEAARREIRRALRRVGEDDSSLCDDSGTPDQPEERR